MEEDAYAQARLLADLWGSATVAHIRTHMGMVETVALPPGTADLGQTYTDARGNTCRVVAIEQLLF